MARTARWWTAAPTSWPTSPTSGHSLVIFPRAIRTGSSLAPRAATNKSVLVLSGAWLFLCVVGIIFSPPWADEEAQAKRARHHSPNSLHVNDYSKVVWPLEISGSQYVPLAWSNVAGW